MYSIAARCRNLLYDKGVLQSQDAGLPVVSVGNITAGGTGKTPFVAWLARFLVLNKRRPAVLSRGYGKDTESGIDDENRMLKSIAPDVPVIVNPERVEGARTARQTTDADVLILDDGFQHRQIARDLDIVLLDAMFPFGGGSQLPLGYLREPIDGLKRADLLVLTRTDLASKGRVEQLTERLEQYAPDGGIVCAVHKPESLSTLGPGGCAEELELHRLQRGRWAAFCGIGNPESFRETLRELGTTLDCFKAYADHHRYRRKDLQQLMEAAVSSGCEGLITTEKDAGKVRRFVEADDPLPVLVLKVRMDFSENGQNVARRVLSAIGPRQ